MISRTNSTKNRIKFPYIEDNVLYMEPQEKGHEQPLKEYIKETLKKLNEDQNYEINSKDPECIQIKYVLNTDENGQTSVISPRGIEKIIKQKTFVIKLIKK